MSAPTSTTTTTSAPTSAPVPTPPTATTTTTTANPTTNPPNPRTPLSRPLPRATPSTTPLSPSNTLRPSSTSPPSQPAVREILNMERKLSHSTAEYIHATRRMIYLTKAVDLTLESLYSGPALSRAIWRYEALWLPLLAALSDPPPHSTHHWTNHAFASKVSEIRSKNFAKGGLQLTPAKVVPPIDIAWVWHVHRLNPDMYHHDLARFARDEPTRRYFQHACATTIATAFKFSDGEDAQSRLTRRLWAIVYPFEPFVPRCLFSCSYAQEMAAKRLDITQYTNEMSRQSFRSLLLYDLEHAARLQRAFLYQIVDEEDPEKGELFESNHYLHRAFTRYLLFVQLHSRASDTFLVPMNDINIIWHMHLSATIEYNHDCHAFIARRIPHDTIAVDGRRRQELERMETDVAAQGISAIDQEAMEDDELADLLEKRRRGVSVRETKAIWEATYGSKPRYDLPDTRYRGEPPGERGGFKDAFEKVNGATRDIPWPEMLARMLLSIVVFIAGICLLSWAFVKTMFAHGVYLLGLPGGLGIMALAMYLFLSIPISRPLSSDSRYWLERSYKQTHDPLPPYLVSSSRKSQ